MLSSRIRNDNSNLSASIQRQRHYERNARTDVLTGLNNRRWLEEMFPRLLERCRLNGAPLSLLMMDVDHFKRYNDTLGHQAGDQALKKVGEVLLSQLRPNDAAVRFGGEEFMVILPNTTGEEMALIAERTRNNLGSQRIEGDAGEALPPITVSVGAAQWRAGDSVDTLIAAADKALYQAKATGRDRVVVSEG
jgi:diguanylate cyclase (GGDEF)-like protein